MVTGLSWVSAAAGRAIISAAIIFISEALGNDMGSSYALGVRCAKNSVARKTSVPAAVR